MAKSNKSASAKATRKTTNKSAATTAPSQKKALAKKPATTAASKTSAVKAKAPTAQAKPTELAHDAIAELAYKIWLEKGQPYGQDSQNWKEAEARLKQANP